MTPTSRFFLSLPLIVLIVAGCSSRKASCTVQGKVNYKGQPVTGGTISFIATQSSSDGDVNQTYGTNIHKDGTYEMPGNLPAGEYVVTVDTESLNKKKEVKGNPKLQKMEDAYREKMGKMGKSSGITSEEFGVYVPIPAKYRDKDKSDVKVKLSNGKNMKDIELKD